MRAIPEAVETLLKSRAQAGENAHNHLVTLAGAPIDVDLADPTDWTAWRSFAAGGRNYGNMAETADGRAICIYCESGAVKIAYAANVAGVLDGTLIFDFTNAITLVSGVSYPCASINLVDGKLNVAIVYLSANPEVRRADFWRDTDGNGTAMAKISDITLSCGPGFDPGYTYAEYQNPLGVSLIQKYDGGNLIVLLPTINFSAKRVQAYYSADDGSTWIAGAQINNGLGDHLGMSSSQSFFFVNATTFWTTWLSSSGSGWFCEWTNSGATCTRRDWDAGWGTWPHNEPWYAGLVAVEDSAFMCAMGPDDPNDVIFYKYILSDWTAANFIKAENWEVVNVIGGTPGYCPAPYFFLLTESALICQTGPSGGISGAGTEVDVLVSIRAKRIEISRNKGMASSATVVFDNKGGIYSPDKAVGAPWKNVMFPNTGIVIQQGYGTELITTFTGTIDDVQMTTFPAEITLTCRDGLKKALDQLITDEAGTHIITYTNQTPETIFGWLAAAAGFATVYVEATGLTLAEKTFTNETYGDAFNWLAELCGFMVYCDEDGAIYYVKDDDDAVPVSDYAFAEGEDIISLGYTISDRDLYSKIIVIGQTADDPPVGVSYELIYYNTYNVLANKKMIINVSEATTEAQCQAIAEQARYVMNARARICEFAGVANPYLQIGDTLTVTETTALISELYKITDVSTSQSSDGGYIMHITCYHYAAPAES